MFDIMQSRWFYLSKKILIGLHPNNQQLILVLRSREEEGLPVEVGHVLHLNNMELAGELQQEDNYQYYPLKEKSNGNGKGTKATNS